MSENHRARLINIAYYIYSINNDADSFMKCFTSPVTPYISAQSSDSNNPSPSHPTLPLFPETKMEVHRETTHSRSTDVSDPESLNCYDAEQLHCSDKVESSLLLSLTCFCQ